MFADDPPSTCRMTRKKKCIIGTIVSVIIITAIVLGIYFGIRSNQNNQNNVDQGPCEGIPGCQVIKSLGSGSFGDVYHVQVSGANPPDAVLKVFKQQQGAPNGHTMMCELEKGSLLEVARRERETGRKLQVSHLRQDIAGVESPRMMTEYFAGYDLQKPGEFRGKPTSELVQLSLDMMDQISNHVLEDLHSGGIYHGDIKPGNIVYDPKAGKFYAIDFGLAVSVSKLQGPDVQYRYFEGGTLVFMSREHLEIMSRVDGGIPLQNILLNNPSMAKRAEHHSLAVSAITFIGENCDQPGEPLCALGKEVVAKWSQISQADQQEWHNLSHGRKQMVLRPIWDTVQKKVVDYKRRRRFYSGQDGRFMKLLADDWKLFPEST